MANLTFWLILSFWKIWVRDRHRCNSNSCWLSWQKQWEMARSRNVSTVELNKFSQLWFVFRVYIPCATVCPLGKKVKLWSLNRWIYRTISDVFVKFAGYVLQTLASQMRKFGSISFCHCWYTGVFTIRYDTIRYDRRLALKNWQTSCQFNLAHKLKKNLLNGTEKKIKIQCKKSQETDGYGRNKRPEIETLKKKEMTITQTKKTETKKKLKRRLLFIGAPYTRTHTDRQTDRRTDGRVESDYNSDRAVWEVRWRTLYTWSIHTSSPSLCPSLARLL